MPMLMMLCSSFSDSNTRGVTEAEVEATSLASVQSPEAVSHMSALGHPLVVPVAKNYIQAIIEKIRYTSCVFSSYEQNVTSTYREKS
jgi:hypothetical protein